MTGDHPPWSSAISDTAQEKLSIARSFVASYIASREGLKTLGILRSERTLQGDYAEWLAAEYLGLELATSGVQEGYDATDPEGNRYQIKSRLVNVLGQSTSWDFKSDELGFDFLLGVFLDHTFDLVGLVRVDRATVAEIGHSNANTFRFRWNATTAADPRVERLVWRKPEAPL